MPFSTREATVCHHCRGPRVFPASSAGQEKIFVLNQIYTHDTGKSLSYNKFSLSICCNEYIQCSVNFAQTEVALRLIYCFYQCHF